LGLRQVHHQRSLISWSAGGSPAKQYNGVQTARLPNNNKPQTARLQNTKRAVFIKKIKK